MTDYKYYKLKYLKYKYKYLQKQGGSNYESFIDNRTIENIIIIMKQEKLLGKNLIITVENLLKKNVLKIIIALGLSGILINNLALIVKKNHKNLQKNFQRSLQKKLIK